MDHLLADYGLFLLKTLTLVAAVIVVALLLASGAARARGAGGARAGLGVPGGKAEGESGRIEITRYNERLDALRESLTLALLEPAARREAAKAKRAREKREGKAARREAKLARKRDGKAGAGERPSTEPSSKPRLFVLDFDGDLRAGEVSKLRREITAVLSDATPADEVLVRLDSGGGTVTGYGLGASQLDRIRKKGIPLTVCVDKVAASGGYMMACVADRLVAAPFAVLGSIGVVAQVPNFHRLLKELNIDVELLTAGKYKRTLTLFGENTDEGREKFLRDIERIHAQFKAYVGAHRPALDIERVSTGEVWSGEDALELHLADELSTSDEILVTACRTREVLLVAYRAKRKGLLERLSLAFEASADRLLSRWLERLLRSRLPGA